VQIEVAGISVMTGCLAFTEDGSFLTSLDWASHGEYKGKHQDLAQSVVPLDDGGAGGSYTVGLGRVPPRVGFLFFVAVVRRGAAAGFDLDAVTRNRVNIKDGGKESICAFQSGSPGPGNAMVMLALIRAQTEEVKSRPNQEESTRAVQAVAAPFTNPTWRAEAVGKVYHLYSGREPLLSLGTHLETLASARTSGPWHDLDQAPFMSALPKGNASIPNLVSLPVLRESRPSGCCIRQGAPGPCIQLFSQGDVDQAGVNEGSRIPSPRGP